MGSHPAPFSPIHKHKSLCLLAPQRTHFVGTTVEGLFGKNLCHIHSGCDRYLPLNPLSTLLYFISGRQTTVLVASELVSSPGEEKGVFSPSLSLFQVCSSEYYSPTAPSSSPPQPSFTALPSSDPQSLGWGGDSGFPWALSTVAPSFSPCSLTSRNAGLEAEY